jgi:hypothetical protein
VLNAANGGAKNSQHMRGLAADILISGMTPLEVCKKIKSMGLVYDQLIHEFGSWCHVSIAGEGEVPRRQDLTASRGVDGKTVYTPGLNSI